MQTIVPESTESDQALTENRLKVVVGLLINDEGELLVQQRRPGTPGAGQWEFPGGKLENGENAQNALVREIDEELGVQITRAKQIAVVRHDYDYGKVELDVHTVELFQGTPVGREGQQICWLTPAIIRTMDVLQAVHTILDRISDSDDFAAEV